MKHSPLGRNRDSGGHLCCSDRIDLKFVIGEIQNGEAMSCTMDIPRKLKEVVGGQGTYMYMEGKHHNTRVEGGSKPLACGSGKDDLV
jgi:hypothetical protein